jgi:TonB-like protein
MISLHSALARESDRPSPASRRMIIVRPPRLSLLPRRRIRPGILVASVFLHASAMAALVWLPPLFAQPVLLAQEHFTKSEPVILDEPLKLPSLPRVEDRGSAPSAGKVSAPAPSVASAAPTLSAPPRTPDYTAPQTIISDVASPVNRVQTILRPDLIAPPSLKFPLRLQTAVILPSPSAPLLAPRPPEPAAPPAPIASPEEAPAIKPTVLEPVLVLTPKKGSVIRAKAAPSQNVAPNLKTVTGTNTNAIQALVVVNAVDVAPDPSAVVPNAQLAGRFVVGPSGSGAGGGNSSPSPSTASATGSAVGHGPSSADGHSSTPGSGTNPSASGKDKGGISISPRSGSGGAGTGPANGNPASGTGAGTVSSGAPGISISGGVSGRNRATTSSLPGRPSYPLMIISGGASGGASRDLGVFNRSETVYSVSIPMADTGGGPDWTMQYALRDPGRSGAGLLVPPMAQKKVAANMKPSAISVDSGPVFISAIIDENGKMQALKAIRAQDTRSQAAMHALEQWEFLPAQLDGKPVASKILMGVAVRVQD